MLWIEGSARTQDLGSKDYPFKKEDIEDAEDQFNRWLSKFSDDLDALIKDIKGSSTLLIFQSIPKSPN